MIYTHELKVGGGGVISRLDTAPGMPRVEQSGALYGIPPQAGISQLYK